MSDHLTAAQLDHALSTLPGWTLKGKAIERQFTLASFADAVAVLTRLAFEAEAADHHPDFLLEYRNLTVRFWTHTADGVTQKDVEAARVANQVTGPYVTPDK